MSLRDSFCKHLIAAGHALRESANPLVNKVVGNAGWQIADNVLRMGIGIIVTAMTARYLGREDFGLLSFATALVALFSSFSSLGIDGILTRELVRNPDKSPQLLASALVLRTAGAVLAVFLAAGGIALLRPGNTIDALLVVLLAAGFLPQAFDVIQLYFQSRLNSRPPALIRSGIFCIFAMVRVLLIAYGYPVLAFALVSTLELLAVATTLFVLLRHEKSGISISDARWATCKTLLLDSLPVFISSIATVIYMRLDQVLLGQYLGDATTGIYSAGIRVTEAVHFIPLALASAVYPVLIAAHGKHDLSHFNKTVQRLYDLMSIIGYAMALPLFVYGHTIIELVFGNSFSEAATVVQITAFIIVSLSVSTIHSKWLLINNYQRYYPIYTVAAVITNVSLNVVLIPHYGFIGAAIACVVSQVAPTVLGLAFPPLRQNAMMMLNAFFLPGAIVRLARK